MLKKSFLFMAERVTALFLHSHVKSQNIYPSTESAMQAVHTLVTGMNQVKIMFDRSIATQAQCMHLLETRADSLEKQLGREREQGSRLRRVVTQQ